MAVELFMYLGAIAFLFRPMMMADTQEDACCMQQPLDLCLVLDDGAGCEHPRQVDGNTVLDSKQIHHEAYTNHISVCDP